MVRELIFTVNTNIHYITINKENSLANVTVT